MKGELSSGRIFSSCENLREDYVNDPNVSFSQPAWYSNTVGFFHRHFGTAVLVARDNSAKTVTYGNRGSKIDTDKIFFYENGEPLDVYW